MRVLVDSSVWIEFFRSRSDLSDASLILLEHLLEEDRTVTIHPIQSELFSGRLDSGKKKQIQEAFRSLAPIDPDWNDGHVWNRIVEMAEVAHRKLLPIPGIVDRMVLVAAEKAGATLWTLDQSLMKMAAALDENLLFRAS